jgi:hypothetical protein
MELFISSDEYSDFSIPRNISQVRRLSIGDRKAIEIKVDHPLIGQKYDLLDFDPSTFYLINRIDEDAFDQLNNFPINVHILIVKHKSVAEPLSIDELQHIAWGNLYDNFEDAKNYK